MSKPDNSFYSQSFKTTSEVREIFSYLNLDYLKKSQIVYPPLESADLEASDYFRRNKREWKKLNKRYGESILNHSLAPLSIQYINKQVGWGVFAERELKKGTFIGEYTGLVQIANSSTEKLPSGGFTTDYAWDYPDTPEGFPELEVNALTSGNTLRFVNHSSKPNLFPDHTLIDGRWVIFFKTLKKISQGSQLTIDYGTEYWNNGYRTQAMNL